MESLLDVRLRVTREDNGQGDFLILFHVTATDAAGNVVATGKGPTVDDAAYELRHELNPPRSAEGG